MKGFTDFLAEYTVAGGLIDPKVKALRFLKDITTSSRMGVYPDCLTYARLHYATVDGYAGSMTLYRGLFLSEPSDLKVGDEVDSTLVLPNTSQVVMHTSKSLDVAKSYAQPGVSHGLVYELSVDPTGIMFDGTQITSAFSWDDLDPELVQYFQDKQEVLVNKWAAFTAKVKEVW